MAEENTFELDEMVVTGSRQGASDPDALPVPVQVIDRAQIEALGAITLDQVLETTVGVELVNSPDQNTSPGFKTLRMQGMDSDYVLILVDGRRLPGSRPTQNGQSFTDISTINVDMIERIEVLRDGASAQYGSDAVAGVINIITRRYVDGMHATTQYGRNTEGDGEEKRLSLTGGLPLGDLWYASLGVSGKQRDHYDRTADTRWDSADFTQAAVSGSLACDPALHHGLLLDWRFADTDSTYRLDQTRLNETTKSERHLGLDWQGNWQKVESGLSAATTGQDILKTRSDDPAYHGDLDWRLDEYAANVRYQPWSWLFLFSGASLVNETIDSDHRGIDRTRRVGALFTEIGLTPVQPVQIQLTARWEDYSDFDDHFAPKAALRGEIIPGLSLRGSVSRTFKAPSLFQLYDDTEVMDWLDLKGNPLLKPSEGISSSTGLVWKVSPEWRTRLACDLFYNTLDNLIDTTLTPKNDGSGDSAGTYVNLPGDSIFRGVNLSFSSDLPYGFSVDTGASRLVAEDPDGHDLTGRPRSSAHLALGWSHEKCKANLRYSYRGQYLDHNRKTIHHFDYFSAQLDYAISGSCTLFAGARNLFDEEPPLNAEDYASGHIEGMVDSNEGARWYAGLRISM